MPRTGKGVKRQEAASIAGGNADSHMQNAEILAGGHADAVQPLWKTDLQVLATLGALLPYKPADTLLGSETWTQMQMFTAALFLTAEIWKATQMFYSRWTDK